MDIRLLRVRKIWGDGRHNAFTGIAAYRKRTFVTFRTADNHMSADGAISVIASDDHESWELVDEASDIAGRDVGKLLCDADADELRASDPTAYQRLSIDSMTEQLIQDALARIFERKTVIVIAHRLSTVERADRIVLLADGRVVEQGTHRELMAAGGAYSRLVRAGEELLVA